jgi:hypothetical protein
MGTSHESESSRAQPEWSAWPWVSTMASGLAPWPNRSCAAGTYLFGVPRRPGVDQYPGTSRLPDEVGVHNTQGQADNPSKYAAFAFLCNPLQRLMGHS